MQLRSLVAVGAAVLCVPGVALASGFSAVKVGTGTSGPATRDPAAVYWNPGMLGFVGRPTALFGSDLVVGNVRYRRQRRGVYQRSDSLDFALPISAGAADPSKTGTSDIASTSPVAPAPSGFFAMPIGDTGLVGGLGIYAPFAALVDFDRNGAQKWAVQSATLIAIQITPAIAWRVNDRLSIGAGVSYVVGFAEFSRVQDFASLDVVGGALSSDSIDQSNDFGVDAPTGVRELDVMSRPIAINDAWARNVTFNVGIAAEPTQGLRLGVSYHHKVEMSYVGDFTLDMNDDFFTQDLATRGLQYDPRVRGDASITVPLPGSFHAGAEYQLSSRVGVGVTGSYTLWSQLEQFDVRVQSPQLAQPEVGLSDSVTMAIPRNWHDTISAEGVVYFNATLPLRVHVLGGYQSAASPDETIDVASPDGDRVVLGFGAQYDVTERIRMVADVELQHVLTRTVEGSDHDLGNGEYEMNITSFGLFTQVAF